MGDLELREEEVHLMLVEFLVTAEVDLLPILNDPNGDVGIVKFGVLQSGLFEMVHKALR